MSFKLPSTGCGGEVLRSLNYKRRKDIDWERKIITDRQVKEVKVSK